MFESMGELDIHQISPTGWLNDRLVIWSQSSSTSSKQTSKKRCETESTIWYKIFYGSIENKRTLSKRFRSKCSPKTLLPNYLSCKAVNRTFKNGISKKENYYIVLTFSMYLFKLHELRFTWLSCFNDRVPTRNKVLSCSAGRPMILRAGKSIPYIKESASVILG